MSQFTALWNRVEIRKRAFFLSEKKLKELQGWVSILLFNWDWISTWKGFCPLVLCERKVLCSVRNISLLKGSPGLENRKQRRKERRTPLVLVHSQVLKVAMALNKIENDRDRQELGREGESAGTTNEEKSRAVKNSILLRDYNTSIGIEVKLFAQVLAKSFKRWLMENWSTFLKRALINAKECCTICFSFFKTTIMSYGVV